MDDSDSEGDFAGEKPRITQNERVFNLHGQGKPIAELSNYSNSDSGGLLSGKLSNPSGPARDAMGNEY